MKKWPSLFIVGIDKAGTTSLHYYLSQIPKIFMSEMKEPWYFAPIVRKLRNPTGRIDNEVDYLNLFEKANHNHEIIGESSAVYWRDAMSAFLIHEKNPNAKIIISIRNPIERHLSGYFMNIRNGRTNLSLHDYTQNFIKNGAVNIKIPDSNPKMNNLYYENIKRYLDIFGKNQVKILIFEEWIKDPKSTVNNILKFLGINSSVNNLQTEPKNVYRPPLKKIIAKLPLQNKISRKVFPMDDDSDAVELTKKNYEKPKLMVDDKEDLVKLYSEDIRKLEKLIGRKLPWEDFSIKC